MVIHNRVKSNSEGESILRDLGIMELEICGRLRVYPREPSETKTVNSNVAVDTYGDWTEIVAINTITLSYQVVGVLIESISATGVFMLQFGDAGDGVDPTTAEIQGEVRFVGTTPIARSTELIPFGCRYIAANRRIMARLKDSVGGSNITISLAVQRYYEVSHEIAQIVTWPW